MLHAKNISVPFARVAIKPPPQNSSGTDVSLPAIDSPPAQTSHSTDVSSPTLKTPKSNNSSQTLRKHMTLLTALERTEQPKIKFQLPPHLRKVEEARAKRLSSSGSPGGSPSSIITEDRSQDAVKQSNDKHPLSPSAPPTEFKAGGGFSNKIPVGSPALTFSKKQALDATKHPEQKQIAPPKAYTLTPELDYLQLRTIQRIENETRQRFWSSPPLSNLGSRIESPAPTPKENANRLPSMGQMSMNIPKVSNVMPISAIKTAQLDSNKNLETARAASDPVPLHHSTNL